METPNASAAVPTESPAAKAKCGVETSEKVHQLSKGSQLKDALRECAKTQFSLSDSSKVKKFFNFLRSVHFTWCYDFRETYSHVFLMAPWCKMVLDQVKTMDVRGVC